MENIKESSSRDNSKIICIKGKVFSGSGEGAKFTELPWVKKQIKEKLGFTPYPGTLNIKLSEESVELRKLLEKAKPIGISPSGEYCRGKCFKAHLIGKKPCAVVLPEIANYPQNVLEIIAPINLRTGLKLKDGDQVEIKILLQ